MSSFWSGWIIVITMANILACFWLIWWTMKKRAGESATGDVTGHTWDGDLQEYNNPLPRWWLWLFYGTLVLRRRLPRPVPGPWHVPGPARAGDPRRAASTRVRWSKAEKNYGPLFAKYGQVAVADLGAKPEYQEARDMGKRLYLTYCMQCHGSTGHGREGFPNLTDKDWLWGGSPEQIEEHPHRAAAPACPHARARASWVPRRSTRWPSTSRASAAATSTRPRPTRARPVRDSGLHRLPPARRQGHGPPRRPEPDRQHLALRRHGGGDQGNPRRRAATASCPRRRPLSARTRSACSPATSTACRSK